MGVPRLFKWLRCRYPQAFSLYSIKGARSFSNNSYVSSHFATDNLYIDTNAIIHSCAQKVFNYGERKRLLDPYAKLSKIEKEEKVFSLTFSKILTLANIARPSTLLYIAIDGCAPAAKMVQQRQRRFLAASKVSDDDGSFDDLFNPNCISPGTEFMERLCEYIKHSIIAHVTDNAHYRVAFSGATVPGEGEHKIMEYVRNHKDTWKMKNCIYGPDGDLIMLALASPAAENFCILRDDLDIPNVFVRIDMMVICNYLLHDLYYFPTKDKTRMIRDFITMGFLVGNDFLPKITMFYYLEDGMSTLFDTYIEEFSKKGEYLTKGETVSYRSLRRFIIKIAEKESELLISQVRRNLDPKIEDRFVDTVLLVSFGDSLCAESSDDDISQAFDFDEYRKNYNNIKFTDDSAEDVREKYIEGLFWTFKYYIVGCTSFQWYYPYYYAPLMTDLGVSIRKIPKFEENKPHEPYQQLLSVMPPRSVNLLPPALRFLMIDEKSPLARFYPSEFEVDYEGKYKEHQGIPLLPFVDTLTIRKTYEKYASETLRKEKRNRKSLPFLYSHSEVSKKIKTLFGTLNAKVDIALLN